MDIVLVIYGSIEQVTGGYLYDRKVVAWLQKKGVGVKVFSLPKRRNLLTAMQGFTGSVRVLCRDADRRDEKLPLLVVDELTHPSFFLPLLLRSRTVPHLVTLVHHLHAEERIGTIRRLVAKIFEKVLLNHSAYIIVNSGVTEDSVRKLLKNEVPIQVCRPGCDTFTHLTDSAAQERGAGIGDEVRLLTVGNVIPRKGHIALISTLLTMTGLNWHLTIVGRDEPHTNYSMRLHAAIDDGGIGGRVIFTGTVDDGELVRLYEISDLFLFPSFHEGYGIALAEALSCGLPYVAFDSGGVREISGPAVSGGTADGKGNGAGSERLVGHNKSNYYAGALRCRGGFLVHRDEPEAFGFVLKELIEDGELRRRLSAEARERFRELPLWEETGSCFYRALQAASGIAGA